MYRGINDTKQGALNLYALTVSLAKVLPEEYVDENLTFSVSYNIGYQINKIISK